LARFKRLSGRILVVIALLAGVFTGVVVTQSLVQRRAPTDVMAGYGFSVVPSPQSLFHKNRVAVLLLGIDYDYDSKDQEMSANSRADTIKAIALNLPSAAAPAGSVSLLSVPRDIDVVMPNGRENKINAAYGGFNGNSAIEAHSQEKVGASFLGVAGFDRYLTLRINATKSLVDAIGGIDVVPDETMNYDDNWGHLHIHFIGGKKYHMNGEQAVSYSRFRHDACSDPCRIKRQDQVIRLTVAKLKNDKFNDLLHINALIDVVRRNVYTDMSAREMLSLAWAFQHVDPSKLDAQQVPFVADKDLACCGDVLIADDATKNALVKRMFLDASGGAALPNAGAVAALDPSKIAVDVENGSGIRGEGAKLADALRKDGFRIANVGNAHSFDYDATEIHVHSSATPLAGERVRSALALKTATVRPDPGASAASDVTVIVGRDFVTSLQKEASAVR